VAPSDADGHKKGDLLATLDAELARRINEAAHRMTDCVDGKNFDTAHGTRKRRGTASYGQALCAAEGIVGMAGKGGAFADLTLLSHEKVGIEFAATAVKAKEALLVLTNFITAYGPMLAIPEDLAGTTWHLMQCHQGRPPQALLQPQPRRPLGAPTLLKPLYGDLVNKLEYLS
jgi:hypothetical protein